MLAKKLALLAPTSEKHAMIFITTRLIKKGLSATF